MTALAANRQEEAANPIDLLEELVGANEWRFERTTEAEMIVEIDGRWCGYRLQFIWHEELKAIYFSCVCDVRVPRAKWPAAAELLALVNDKLWLGHFDLSAEELVPIFRHTLLMRGFGSLAVEPLEDLVDIAIGECERFYPAFQFLVWAGKTPREALDAAILETVGEA